MKQIIKDRNGRKRILDDRSLENLKLGPIFRDQGKQRFNTTLRPETIAWLKRGGNASQRIEDLVDAARSGYLQGFQVDKTDANDELEKLKAQVAELEGQPSPLELIDEYLAEHELTERIKDLNKNRTLQYLGKFRAWLLKR